jgi:nitrite reductase (NADH) small subunit
VDGEEKIFMQAIPKAIWVEVSMMEDLPVDTGKTVRYGGLEIAIFRLSSGKVLAIENRCPHKNGVLAEGLVCDDHVFCPMHDRKIHLPSGKVQKPDTGCVSTYEVSVANNTVYVAFPG